jgi:hypothetical protein
MAYPQHRFHGYAAGFGARLDRNPFQVAEASTALAAVGGRATVIKDDYKYQDLFEFKESASSVLGHYYFGAESEHGVLTTAETRVSAYVRDFVIPGVLRVDRVSMALVSERDFCPESDRRYRIEEARIVNLRVESDFNGGQPFNFDFHTGFIPIPDLGSARGITGDRLQEALRGLKPHGRRNEILEAERERQVKERPALRDRPLEADEEYVSYCSDLGAYGPSLPQLPAFTVTKGNTTYHGSLFEVSWRRGMLELSMLRVAVSTNPRLGEGSVAAGGVNGSPPR